MKYNTKALIFILACAFLSCGNPIKNESSAEMEEHGTKFGENNGGGGLQEISLDSTERILLGFWVGDFEQDGTEKYESHGEAAFWNMSNKINISIDRLVGDSVFGHSVVAGNNRPFKGTWDTKIGNMSQKYSFKVVEPGDNRYDGAFQFEIVDTLLTGTWRANRKLDISKRKYNLKKVYFEYDSSAGLEIWERFVNWEKDTRKTEYSDTFDGEIEKWIDEEFATTTDIIYKINASSTLLKKKHVANMKKEDLRIIRNAIYARHGYSFKNRPLRFYFDSQEWYIPISTDIKDDLTELEKENIKLLLVYEKNAEEYYDSFGR